MSYQENGKDKVLKLVITPAILVSAYFTAKVLHGLWIAGGTIDEYFAVIFGAIFITAAEIYCFRRFILREDWIALILGVIIASVSIVGSFGAFQTGFVRNLLSSYAYTSAQRGVDNLDAQIEAKQKQADGFKADGQKWNERAARRELQELNTQRENAYKNLDEAKNSGNAEGNAVYSGVGAFFAMPEDQAARNLNGYISLIVEIIMIAFVIWDAKDEREISPTPKRAKKHRGQEEEPEFSRNGGNGQVEKKNSGLSSKAGVEGKKKKMERNLAKLEHYLETHEYTTQRKMAEYLGVSTETIRKYLSILEERGYLEQQTLHN